MNNFSLIGKFHKFEIVDKKYIKLIILTSSPFHKNFLISVIISAEEKVYQMQKGDMIGVNGFIDISKNSIFLTALSITWLSKDKK